MDRRSRHPGRRPPSRPRWHPPPRRRTRYPRAARRGSASKNCRGRDLARASPSSFSDASQRASRSPSHPALSRIRAPQPPVVHIARLRLRGGHPQRTRARRATRMILGSRQRSESDLRLGSERHRRLGKVPGEDRSAPSRSPPRPPSPSRAGTARRRRADRAQSPLRGQPLDLGRAALAHEQLRQLGVPLRASDEAARAAPRRARASPDRRRAGRRQRWSRFGATPGASIARDAPAARPVGLPLRARIGARSCWPLRHRRRRGAGRWRGGAVTARRNASAAEPVA